MARGEQNCVSTALELVYAQAKDTASLMEGFLSSVITQHQTCQGCKHASIRDIQMTMPCYLRFPNVENNCELQLWDMIAHEYRDVILQDVSCSRCQANKNAILMTDLTWPTITVFCFARLIPSDHVRPSITRVTNPVILPPILEPPTRRGEIGTPLRLVAFWLHTTSRHTWNTDEDPTSYSGTEGGHYVAYTQNAARQWFLCDDDHITPCINIENILEDNARKIMGAAYVKGNSEVRQTFAHLARPPSVTSSDASSLDDKVIPGSPAPATSEGSPSSKTSNPSNPQCAATPETRCPILMMDTIVDTSQTRIKVPARFSEGQDDVLIVVDTGSTYNLIDENFATLFITDHERSIRTTNIPALTLGDGTTRMKPIGIVKGVRFRFLDTNGHPVNRTSDFIVMNPLVEGVILGHQFFIQGHEGSTANPSGDDAPEISYRQQSITFGERQIPWCYSTRDPPMAPGINITLPSNTRADATSTTPTKPDESTPTAPADEELQDPPGWIQCAGPIPFIP
jgi:hypothetical protein